MVARHEWAGPTVIFPRVRRYLQCKSPEGLLVGGHEVDVFVAQRDHSELSSKRWSITCGECVSERGDSVDVRPLAPRRASATEQCSLSATLSADSGAADGRSARISGTTSAMSVGDVRRGTGLVAILVVAFALSAPPRREACVSSQRLDDNLVVLRFDSKRAALRCEISAARLVRRRWPGREGRRRLHKHDLACVELHGDVACFLVVPICARARARRLGACPRPRLRFSGARPTGRTLRRHTLREIVATAVPACTCGARGFRRARCCA